MNEEYPDTEESFERALDAAGQSPDVPRCFIEWLQNYWPDNTRKEAEQFWVETLHREWWTAALDLKCLAAILRDPPDDLRDTVRTHAQIALRKETQPGYFAPGTHDEYVAWLREIYEHFRDLFNQVTAQWIDDVQ